MEHPKFSKIDMNAIKICASGGMATEEVVARKWEKLTGTILLEGYDSRSVPNSPFRSDQY